MQFGLVFQLQYHFGWQSAGNKFKHKNLFVGVNGFVEFVHEGKRENITTSSEVNFDEVTDLYIYQVEKKGNFNYAGTDFLYVWLNTNTGKIAHAEDGTYDKNQDEKLNPVELTFKIDRKVLDCLLT